MTIKSPFPEKFLERLEKTIPKDKFNGVIDAFMHQKLTTLRVNTLKCRKEDLIEVFNQHGYTFTGVPWYPDAFIMTNVRVRELSELPEYAAGSFYIQSLSSMLPPLVIDPQETDMILDMAAAPGSKTTQMAALMHNQGKIVACDNSQIRLYKLQSNLNIQGVTNVQTLRSAGQILWKSYPEYFDKTLVDVPCSMEGRFYSGEPKSFETWSTAKIRQLSEIQKWMLRSAVSATKPGGLIVYSTCTISAEENESVIEWILKKEKDALVTEPVNIPDFRFSPALTVWQDKVYTPQIKNCVRVYPDENVEGFFVAKLRKLKSTVPSGFGG